VVLDYISPWVSAIRFRGESQKKEWDQDRDLSGSDGYIQTSARPHAGHGRPDHVGSPPRPLVGLPPTHRDCRPKKYRIFTIVGRAGEEEYAPSQQPAPIVSAATVRVRPKKRPVLHPTRRTGLHPPLVTINKVAKYSGPPNPDHQAAGPLGPHHTIPPAGGK